MEWGTRINAPNANQTLIEHIMDNVASAAPGIRQRQRHAVPNIDRSIVR